RPEVHKHPERKPSFATTSGIPLEPLYSPPDVDSIDYREQIGFPGEYPFTRGVYPTMYRGRPWTMRQYAGFGTAEETNARFRFLLDKGQTGLSVAFDLPTQMGYDSDDPLAEGEVGKVSVAIDSLQDMRILFDHISLASISTSMTINATAPILLAMYVALGEEQGIERNALSGTVQNDILKEYIARGTFIFPPGPSMRLVTDTFAWCAEHLPNWNPISISGYHIREAGSTAVQELAFTLADAIAYVEAGVHAGLEVDSFAARLSFFFNVHNHFIEEIAKFRSARRIWAAIMKDRFKARKSQSMRLRFHTQTAGCTLTAQQPENNIVRVTLQALAAVLGGTQSLHTNSWDEALGLPSDRAARTALRTQQVILEESGVTETMDPLGGSYAVESLTDDIEHRTLQLIATIDEMGGMVNAIEARFPQAEIEKSSYHYQKSIEKGEQRIVGVNSYREPDQPLEPFRLNPGLEKNQIERLRTLKQTRNSRDVSSALHALRSAAKGRDNLFPFILACVTCYATLGEICAVLADTFGRYREGMSSG
ncbi:MAG: methylmalonyl-CoA mutase family protein, partial [Candidatus Latescibacterota bacterium]